jgi:D-alanyl-D-alanine carboxypeptidase
LQAGHLDRALLTEDAAYYFTPTTLADYRTSLSPLGAPTKIEQAGRTRLRGGFVNRSYRVTYPGRTLRISTYAEPGTNGKIEQFLVSPAE